MFRLLHVTLLIVPALASSALAQATPNGAASLFPYSAATAVEARQQGSVTADGLVWTCTGSRCTASGPSTPTAASCSALFRAVGEIFRFGRHGGAQLSEAQLAASNAGAAPSRALQVNEYGSSYPSRRARSSTALGGRVNCVIEPVLDPNRWLLLWSIGAERDHWTFGGCEITPFSPWPPVPPLRSRRRQGAGLPLECVASDGTPRKG